MYTKKMVFPSKHTVQFSSHINTLIGYDDDDDVDAVLVAMGDDDNLNDSR